MKLVFMGQQGFARDVLAKLLEAGVDEVVAVYCEPDGREIDPVKELALEHNLPVHQPEDYNDSAIVTQLRSYAADLMIMTWVNIFLPTGVRDAPALGTICFHPSLLPSHRGPSAANWPIIMGEEKSGYSWFYPSDKLDQGEILLQWQCAIDKDDSFKDLTAKKIFPAAVESVLEVCDLFRTGSPPRIQQNEALAGYERRCTKKHSHIDWFKPVDQVYNLIRGANPMPGAWTTYNGMEVSILDSARLEGDGIAARVMKSDKDGITIQSVGGRILVLGVKPKRGKKLSADEWAASVGLSVGDTLGM